MIITELIIIWFEDMMIVEAGFKRTISGMEAITFVEVGF